MKTYKIIGSDILFKGKLFSENSTINLDDKDASSLSAYLVPLSQDRHLEPARRGGSKDLPKSSKNNNNRNNKRK